MKKVKEYLNNKPKLKKALKILAVIGVIFSVSFNILIIGVGSCSIHNSNEHDSNDIKEPLATTPVAKGLANYEDLYYLSSFTDYTTIDFLYNLLEYEATEGYNHFRNADGVHQTIYFYDEIYRINFNDIDFSDIPSSELGYELRYIDYWGSTSTNAYTDRFVKFQFVSNDNWYFYVTFRTFATSNATDPQSQVLKGNLYNTLIRFNYSDTLAPYFDLGLFAYKYGMSARQLQLMFKFQDEQGFQTGYDVGYDNGYSRGYRDGLDYTGDHFASDNPFYLIAQAFSSLANILNIQVLPNLTLGVLLFTPIIIAVIIVIVKMIKG